MICMQSLEGTVPAHTFPAVSLNEKWKWTSEGASWDGGESKYLSDFRIPAPDFLEMARGSGGYVARIPPCRPSPAGLWTRPTRRPEVETKQQSLSQ